VSKRRDTFSSDPTPYQPRSGIVEAAKHLMNTTRRFVADRANVGDVNAAIALWHEAFVALAAETAP
jgi:hypothetical protein